MSIPATAAVPAMIPTPAVNTNLCCEVIRRVRETALQQDDSPMYPSLVTALSINVASDLACMFPGSCCNSKSSVSICREHSNIRRHSVGDVWVGLRM